MGNIGNRYKNTISLIVEDTINNYIISDRNPEEKGFREWLSTRKMYYNNRITNEVIKRKPIEKAQAVGYIAVEIYKIMERDYESTRT